MAALRLFDLFNVKIDTTQVVGAETFDVDYGYRTQQAGADGGFGVAARDRTAFYANARLACQDIGTFPALVAQFEAAESLSIFGEGKVAGDASKSNKIEFKHAKLVAATLSFRQGGYAASTFDFRNSAAAASAAPNDEVAITEVAEKAITHATGLRGVRITGASFDPEGVDPAITPLAVTGLDLSIRWGADQSSGDDDFGEVVEAMGFEIGGTLGFVDVTLDTGATVSQQLIAAIYGALAITYTEQNAVVGADSKTLTINNVIFETARKNLASRRFHGNTLGIGCFSQVGADWFTIGTGANKILAVA